MPIKVYHPDHGFVLTGDQREVDALVAKGGKIVIKNKEAFLNDVVLAKANEPTGLRTTGLAQEVNNENQKIEETTKTKILKTSGRPRLY